MAAKLLGSDHLYNVAEARLQAAEAVHTEQLQLLQAQSRERELEANEMRRFETDRADSLATILSEVEEDVKEKEKARALEVQQFVARLDEAGCQTREAQRAADKATAERDAMQRERDALADELRECRRKLEEAVRKPPEGGRHEPESAPPAPEGAISAESATPAESGKPSCETRPLGSDLEVVVPLSPALACEEMFFPLSSASSDTPIAE